LPESPGVYIYKNKEGNVIYVGKAVNLKRRVSSYFKNKNLLDAKSLRLIESTNSIDYILVESEVEALLLEADLVKKYMPKYNITLKDDKNFKYIQIRKDKFKDGKSIHRLLTARKGQDPRSEYLGPFPYGDSVNVIMKSLRRIFPYRDCSVSKFLRYKKLSRPCLYGYTEVCPAPCVDEGAITYNNENVKKFKRFISGNKKKLINTIKEDMDKEASRLNYEVAAKLRDQIKKLKALSFSSKSVTKEYIENPNFLIHKSREDVKELKKVVSTFFPTLDRLERIEFYDISNISGKNAVGSMVVNKHGLIDRSQYRRFRIKSTSKPNDPEMMQEVVLRRIKRTDWESPDLIALDGGKGQLSVVREALTEESIQIPLLALAKKKESLIYCDPKRGTFEEITLPKSNRGLQLLIRLRDEAHRFAIEYHRKLRIKKLTSP